MLGVPTMLVALLESQAQRCRDTASVRVTVSGGSMVPPELVRRVCPTFAAPFQTVYGQTEVLTLLTQVQTTNAFEDVCGTGGQAMPQTELSIRDPSANIVMPVGDVGEICVAATA